MAREGTGHDQVKIKIDGQEVGNEPKHRAGNVRLVESIDDHHRLEVEFYTLLTSDHGNEGVAALDDLQGKVGGAVEVEWIEANSDTKRQWKGILSGAEARLDNTGAYSVTLRGASESIKLDTNPMNKVFNDVKLSDVVATLCKECGVKVKCDSTKTTYRQLVMAGESPYRFLRRVLAAEGMFFFYDGESQMMATANPGLGTHKLTAQEDLLEFSLSAEAQPMLSTVTTWDEATAKTLDDPVKAPSSSIPLASAALDAAKNLFKPTGDRDPELHGESLAALEADSIGLAKTLASRMYRGQGTSARVSIISGGAVEIEGVSAKFSGKYLVSRVTHTLDAKGYSNHFECTPADIAGPRRFARPAGPQFRTGVVSNIEADLRMGYAAKVTWANSHGGTTKSTESDWLRLAMPHAGKGHGWALMPEIGDEVIVAFEGGDLTQGVILGSLYNGKNKGPADEIAEGLPDNNNKLFTTRSGHKLLFSDAAGDEFIEITTKDAECSIKMNVAGPDITITTTGELKVTADKAMTFESQDAIKFKAAKNIELEATGDIAVKATGKTNIEGMEVNTDAKMKSSLKAGMQVEVKGGSGTVKASPAGVDVQGPLVKLN